MFERLGTLAETIMTHASFLTDERTSELSVDMREHPEDYPRCHELRLEVEQAERELRKVLGEHQCLLTSFIEAVNVRNGVENEYIYKLGFMDGARTHFALVTHELPHQLTDRKEDVP